jgi:hypothetical protein
MWDTTARRAAQLPPAAPREEAAPAASGRRAAAPAPAPVAEPLTYSTQSRPAVPSYDGPSFRNRPAEPQAADDALPPTQAIPKAEQPAYRVRDFSPESRRAATPAPTWNPPAAPAEPPSDLEYHTEARVPAPIAEVPPALVEPPREQTMSRRALRAIQHGDEAITQSQQPAPASQSLAQQLQAPSEPAVEAEQPMIEPPAAQQVTEPELSPFEALFRGAREPVAEPQTVEQPQVAQQRPAEVTSIAEPPTAVSPLPPVAPEPAANTALNDAIAEFDALTRSQQPVQAADEVANEQQPGVWTPPVGHWSTQADLDDENQLPENTINRKIGSGSTATNALVLPGIPLGNDIRGPLTSTGEIMLTGSIDLPRTLSASGTSDRFDHDGLDALFDVNDHEVISTDSAPVRAIRAVSTHPSGHGVTHTQKPKGNRALTALLIAASSMAVVVAGLLVAAFAFNVF